MSDSTATTSSTAPPATDGTTSTSQAPATGQPPSGQTSPTGQATGQQDQQTSGKTFTQAELDAIIGDRVRREQEKHAALLKAEQEKAGKSDLEKAQIEKEAAEKAATEASEKAARAVAEARVEAALAGSGVKKERIEAVARLIDVDEIAKAPDAKKAAAAAVEQAKKDFPEFWAGTAPAASGGDLNPPTGGVTAEQFKAMNYSQRAELYKRDPERYRQLAKLT